MNDSSDNTKPAVLFSYGRLIWVVEFDGLLALLVLCLFLYLTVRLGKRAWNTTSKRFSRFFEIFLFVLTIISFSFGIFCIIKNKAEMCSCPIGSFLPEALFVSPVYFMSISATALLFQVAFPWLPERSKKHLQSCVATRFKVFLEVIALLLITTYNIFWLVALMSFGIANKVICDHVLYKVLCFYSLSITVMMLILNIFSAFCLLIFFCLVKQLATYTKRLLLKLLSLSAIIIFNILISIVLLIVNLLHRVDPHYLHINDAIILFPQLYVNFVSVLVFLTVTTLLTHPQVVWCCCCSSRLCLFRRSDANNNNMRTPLIHHDSELGQATNPLSVPRNDPSGTTATVYHPEMTDCRSDYEQLILVSPFT